MQWLYLCAGMVLPLFYLPQILHCLRDNTQLRAFSMSKSVCQLLLRLAMLPFLWHVGNTAILAIALFDLLGRTAELSVALWSLRQQRCSWRTIGQRLNPLAPVRLFVQRWSLSASKP